jgi:hypothetical protein
MDLYIAHLQENIYILLTPQQHQHLLQSIRFESASVVQARAIVLLEAQMEFGSLAGATLLFLLPTVRGTRQPLTITIHDGPNNEKEERGLIAKCTISTVAYLKYDLLWLVPLARRSGTPVQSVGQLSTDAELLGLGEILLALDNSLIAVVPHSSSVEFGYDISSPIRHSLGNVEEEVPQYEVDFV